MALHDNLKNIREERKITKKELCTKTGISERAYLTYEFGEREPKIGVIAKLADFYGVTTDYLLGREPKAPEPNPFADMNLDEDDEKEVISKYMSLPPEVRAMMLDVLLQLADAARKRQSDAESNSNGGNPIQQSTNQKEDDKYIIQTTTVGKEMDRLEAERARKIADAKAKKNAV